MTPNSNTTVPISRLLGCPVREQNGQRIGHVTDVRLRPARTTGGTPVLRVQALLVDVRHVGSQFGYERNSQRGPWLVRAVIRRLHRQARLIEWRDVDSFDADGKAITLRTGYSARAADA